MKSKVLLLVLIGLAPAFRSLHADTLDADPITITGSIIQETGSTGQTTIKPITIENLVLASGTTGVAKTLRYYFDEDSNSGDGGFVIAPKAVEASGSGTPVATVFAFGNDSVEWTSTKNIYFSGGEITGLNSNLSGTQTTMAHPKTVINFILFGEINNIPTIMKGTLHDGNGSR